MGIIALVMAGGRATRMKSREKPLVEICGKSMIERVIEVLRNCKHIDDIVVATSKFTPKTAEKMRASSVKVVETSGDDYHIDMRGAIRGCKLFSPVLVISADLPLITKGLIDEVIAKNKRCEKQSMMVAVQARAYERLGLKSECHLKLMESGSSPMGSISSMANT